MDPEVPLVIPEINPEAVARSSRHHRHPNCSTIIAINPTVPIIDKSAYAV